MAGMFDQFGNFDPVGEALGQMQPLGAPGGPGQPPGGPMAGYGAQQPQGLWDQLTGVGNPAGLAGNPLLQMGLGMLEATSRGQSFGGGLSRGLNAANRAQVFSRGQDMQEAQTQALLDARAEKRARELAVREAQQRALGTPEVRKMLGPLADLGQVSPDIATSQLLQSQFAAPPERRILKGADGYNYYADTGERVLPDVLAAATGGEDRSLGPKDILGMAKELGATMKSTAAALASGNVTDLKPRTVRETPPQRSDIAAIQKEATTELAPIIKAGGALSKIRNALQQNSGVGDIATIYGVISALDPESVVREGEVALFQNAISTLDRLLTTAKRELGEGGVLPPSTKREIAVLAQSMQGMLERGAQDTLEALQRRAASRAIESDALGGVRQPRFPEPSMWDELTRGPETATPAVTQDIINDPEILKAMRAYDIDAYAPGARQKLQEALRRDANGPLRF